MTDDELSLEEQIERAQAQPGIAVVVEVIGQCHASGIETRFNRGRWEKYLKTKGWTPA